MVDVAEGVGSEIQRYTIDLTGQQVELMDTGRAESKKPHLGFNLLCLGSRSEPSVRATLTSDWYRTGNPPNSRQEAGSRQVVNGIHICRTIMEPVMKDQCHFHGE